MAAKCAPSRRRARTNPVVPDSTTLLAPVLGLDAIGAEIEARNVHRPELVRHVLGLPQAGSARLTPAQAAQLLMHADGGAKAMPAAASFMPMLNKADSPLRLLYGRLVARTLSAHGQPALLTVANATDRAPVVERWGPVAVVVLAAGASRRMGRPKQVEPIDGVPMVVRAARVAGAAGVGPVILVTGAQDAAVLAALAEWSSALPGPVQVVQNPDWATGQATSMHAALRTLPPTVGAAIFVPVDQPFLNPLLLRQLARAWHGGANLAAPTVGRHRARRTGTL